MLAWTITLNKGYLSTITILKMFLSPAAWKSNIYEELFMPTNRSVMGSFNITHHSSTSNLPERCYLILTYTHLISKTRLKLWKQLGLLFFVFCYKWVNGNKSCADRVLLAGILRFHHFLLKMSSHRQIGLWRESILLSFLPLFKCSY